MIKKSVLLIGMFAVALPLYSADKMVLTDLDFSRGGEGYISNQSGKKGGITIPTLSPYGRFRGDSALPENGTTYPQSALDRKGEWKALRFGEAKQYIQVPNVAFEGGKPFTIETWIYIYSSTPLLDGYIMDAGFGFKNGFRLTCTRAKYAKDGWLCLGCGDGKTTKFMFAKNGTVNAWHHLVLTSTGESMAFYVDGVPAQAERPEQTPEKFYFEKNTPLMFGGSPRGATDLKTDFLAVLDQAMSAEEVMKRYEAGKTTFDGTEQEKLMNTVKLEIPVNSSGYFKIGEEIPVTVSVLPELKVTTITVNGKEYRPTEKIVVKFDQPGVFSVDIKVAADGKIIRSATYPIAVIPPAKNTALYGVNSIVTKSPASFALGCRLSREVIYWHDLEPEKGKYAWVTTDRIIEWNKKHGVETVFCLTGIPSWAKIPQNLENYKKLWQLVFARYDLKYGEVWTADHRPYSQCSPDIYKLLLSTAKETAGEENANICILAGRFVPGTNSFWTWLRHVPASFDILSLDLSTTDPTNNTLKTLCENHEKKPVWVTSGGFAQQYPGVPGNQSMLSEKDSAAADIRAMILAFANGAKEWFASSGPDQFQPIYNAFDGQPGWKGVAFGVFNSMVGKGAILKFVPGKPGLTTIGYENPDKSTGLIIFAAQNKVEVDSPGEAFGLFGEKLGKGKISVGSAPVYLPGTSKL